MVIKISKKTKDEQFMDTLVQGGVTEELLKHVIQGPTSVYPLGTGTTVMGVDYGASTSGTGMLTGTLHHSGSGGTLGVNGTWLNLKDNPDIKEVLQAVKQLQASHDHLEQIVSTLEATNLELENKVKALESAPMGMTGATGAPGVPGEVTLAMMHGVTDVLKSKLNDVIAYLATQGSVDQQIKNATKNALNSWYTSYPPMPL